MRTVAIAIMCKTPAPGQSKTRLSPPLRPEDCAELSACFIRDVAGTVAVVAGARGAVGYAVYTPLGSEAALQPLLPAGFKLMPQVDGDLGARVTAAIAALLGAGHQGAILVNSDSPTLPPAILSAAVDAVRHGDRVVLGQALDGGYTLVGLTRPHRRLFEDIPWSTDAVYQRTLERAREIGLPVVKVPGWYDVDDRASLAMLADELSGSPPAFSHIAGADAPATRRFLGARARTLLQPVRKEACEP